MFAEMLARQEAIRLNRELELRMIKRTTQGLFDLMKPHFAGFPDNYLVFDLETTGLNPGSDLAVQIGYCLVKGGKPVDQMGVILDWTSMPDKFPHEKLRSKLAATKQAMEFKDGQPTGKKYHHTFERMRDEGIPPLTALSLVYDLFQEVRKQKHFFMAHNGYHFDVPFIEGHFNHFLSGKYGGITREPFYFNDNDLFDTGMVEKGSQSQSVPWASDTVKSWSLRTQHERLRNVKWSLDMACVPRYKLAEKYGLDMNAAHDAGFDCYVCHLLFEEYKYLLNNPDIKEPDPLYMTKGVVGPTPRPPWA